VRAKRGLSIDQLKIGNVEMETDPEVALKDFQAALQRADTLSKEEQKNLATLRMRGMLQRKEANALAELGEYSKAEDIFAEVDRTYQNFAAADSQDLRAMADLEVALDDEAVGFEAAADPALGADGSDRRRALASAEQRLSRAIDIIARMLKQDPSNENWRTVQADAQVRLSAVQAALHTPEASQDLAKTGIAAMRDLTRNDHASPMTLDQAANAFLKVAPASLRDPQYAVACAERAVALSHRRTPSLLLTLAEAYRAEGQKEKSRATANEGLALLPAALPGSMKPRIRKLLEIQARAGN
jgi:tetratricopeptide (TPR) repeat protein